MTGAYRAFREGAAWLDLSARGNILVRGGDRVRWLHAMATNHIERLTPGHGCYAFFLNAQGRVLADAHILCLPDHLLLDIEPEPREKLLAHLDKHIIADDVTLEDATVRVATLGLEGPRAAEILASLGAPTPPAPHIAVEWGDRLVARLSATGSPGYRVFLPAVEKGEFVQPLEAAGAVKADEEDIRTLRLEMGRPRYGEDILESNLPQETQLMHALHFNKGCYVGQEIVERIRSRGHVNRLLVQLRVHGQAAPPPGTRLSIESREVGEITSAALSPSLGGAVAFAYVRSEQARPETRLMAGEAAAVVTASAPV